MNPRRWREFYKRISEDLGFSMDEDYASSLVLSGVIGDRSRLAVLEKFNEDSANVFGNGPNLEDQIHLASDGLNIVADSAISIYLDLRGYPDMIVTDLDGDIESLIRSAEHGVLMVVHAHGDNSDRIRSVVPEFKGPILATTQNWPLWNVFNFGGFTDGDRAAFLADYMGFSSIRLYGFHFEMPGFKPGQDEKRKIKKLAWARKLLEELATERGTALLSETDNGVITI